MSWEIDRRDHVVVIYRSGTKDYLIEWDSTTKKIVTTSSKAHARVSNKAWAEYAVDFLKSTQLFSKHDTIGYQLL